MEMESSSLPTSTSSKMAVAVSSSTSSKLSSKRLLFDRRYGWVYDEWKDPSEEALAGGRGMFCIVPLTKTFLKTASQWINLAASSAADVYDRRADLLSPQSLQASFNDQLHKFTSILQKGELNCSSIKANSSSDSASSSSHLHMGNP